MKKPLVILLLVAILSGFAPSLAQGPGNVVEPKAGPVNYLNAPGSSDEARAQLNDMIKNDYAYWTGSFDDPLTIMQIGRLQRNPNVKGGQAVLMGALGLTLGHGHGYVYKISYDQLMELVNNGEVTLATSGEFHKSNDRPPTHTFKFLVLEYTKEFKNLLSNMDPKGSFSLWGTAGKPTLDGVQQGQVGDCYWLAALDAVMLQRPSLIEKMIVQISPEKYEVRFPGFDQPIDVLLTAGSMAQFNTDNYDGCWLTILALGEAYVRSQEPDMPEFWCFTTLGVLAHGGSQKRVLEILTGLKYKSIDLNNVSPQRIATMLDAAMQDRAPVGIEAPGHCLSIKDFDHDSRLVTIMNPWGTSDDYTIENTNTTVRMDNGLFTLRLREFCNDFTCINIPVRYVEETRPN